MTAAGGTAATRLASKVVVGVTLVMLLGTTLVRKPRAAQLDAGPGAVVVLALEQPTAEPMAAQTATTGPVAAEAEDPVAEELGDDTRISDAELSAALGSMSGRLVTVAGMPEFRLHSQCLQRAPLVVVSLTAAGGDDGSGSARPWDLAFTELYDSQHYVFELAAARAGPGSEADAGADAFRLVSSPGAKRKGGTKDANGRYPLANWLKRLELKYADVLRVDLSRAPGSGALLMRMITRALPFTQVALRFDAPGKRSYPETTRQRIVSGLKRRGFSVIATSSHLGAVTLIKSHDIPYCEGKSSERGP